MPFDDDDNPIVGHAPTGADGPTAEEALEDEVADFRLLKSMFEKKGVSSKAIRKGEKDFESHGTRAQDNALESSRLAMEDVLSYTRIHRPDAWVRAWYFPNRLAGDHDDEATRSQQPAQPHVRERVVVVEHERGHWMKDAGRACPGAGAGRLWLLPEEALYLVERGTIDLWWPNKTFEELLGPEAQKTGPEDYEAGLPLSLEAVYSLLIGEEGEQGKVSLPKYQVYGHLKRGGFNILRAPPDIPATESSTAVAQGVSLWSWMFSLITWTHQIGQHRTINTQGPLVSPGLYRAYRPIYQQLVVIPRHKPVPVPPDPVEPSSPWKVFYHVHKTGGAPFSKRSPPPPDFRLAVTDTSSSFVPTLEEITGLMESTPHDPPRAEWQGPGRLYQRLKHGHRNVLVAVVDRGLVNFMRFGEGAFGEELLWERFDSRGGGARGGKKGGGRGGGRHRGGRGRGRGRGR